MSDEKSIRTINERLAVIDVETTGLSPKTHEVIEIGCVIFEQTRTGGEVAGIKTLEEWECKLTPERMNYADPVALKINGYGEAAWQDSLSQKDALRQFSQKITDLVPGPVPQSQPINSLIIIGHNVYYDLDMLAHSYERHGISHSINRRVIDTYSFARAIFRHDPIQHGFSLHALCERLGIVNEKAHTALSDARATFELYKKLLEIK
ncbi:MAG TPA: 3'-5' exonuclease [Candidatus Paceibacterota bacterium]